MAKETKRDLASMSRYDAEQQMTIVKLFIENADFRQKVAGVLDQNSLNTNERVRGICAIAKELDSKGVEPSYETIKNCITSKEANAINMAGMLETLMYIRTNIHLSPDDIEWLKNDVYTILVWQETRKLQGKISEILKHKSATIDRSWIVEACSEFEKNTSFTSLGYCDNDLSDDELKSLATDKGYETVTTSSAIIDEMLGGGLRKGDVGILLAGSGVAKTCMTTSFVCMAAGRGYKCAHIVLEDKKDDIRRKYASFVTNIPSNQLHQRKDEYDRLIDKRSKKMHQMLANIKSVFCTEQNGRIRSMSVKDIDRELNRMCRDGFQPDMVVIDYFDRIDKGKGDIWVLDQKTINELLDLATKYNVALWCPSQGNKAAQNNNVEMELSDMSGGAWKSFGAQIVLAAKRCDDCGPNMFKVKTLKNRYATPYIERTTRFNNGTCRFDENDLISQYNEQNEAVDQMYQQRMAVKVLNEQKNR